MATLRPSRPSGAELVKIYNLPIFFYKTNLYQYSSEIEFFAAFLSVSLNSEILVKSLQDLR